MQRLNFAVGNDGENGQDTASAGDKFARQSVYRNACHTYESIIRGEHTFLTIRAGANPVRIMGHPLDALIPLNQDATERHLRLMRAGSRVVYDADKLKPGEATGRVQLCPMPKKQLCGTNKLGVNTTAVKAVLGIRGIESDPLQAAIHRRSAQHLRASKEQIPVGRSNKQQT